VKKGDQIGDSQVNKQIHDDIHWQLPSSGYEVFGGQIRGSTNFNQQADQRWGISLDRLFQKVSPNSLAVTHQNRQVCHTIVKSNWLNSTENTPHNP